MNFGVPMVADHGVAGSRYWEIGHGMFGATARPCFVKAHADQMAHFAAAD
jgi:hypothetical protein